jgi:GT2 family glycosyltransferase
MQQHPVFCIIVTYNGMPWIERCLQSVAASEYPMQCVVVDNCSTDTTVQFIGERFPWVTVICQTSNLGFGQANNKGIRFALDQGAAYLFLINQDVYISPAAVGHLITLLNTSKDYGLLSPVHLNGKADKFDDHFYLYFLKSSVRPVVEHAFISGVSLPPVISTSFVNAAAWMLTRQCVIKIGGFDPIFYHYGEDDNYAQRVLHKGFKIGIATSALICHDNDRRDDHITISEKKAAEKEFLNFLNQVCDPHHPDFQIRYFKRLTRHFLQAGGALVRGKSKVFEYNKMVALKIFQAYSKIKRSRKRTMYGGDEIYLDPRSGSLN